MAKIEFQHVYKSFGSTKVVEDLNLTLEDGKFNVLVGPSGCGKTTLLRMIAGIGPATSGQILLDGQDISNIPPGKRGVAMVFQSYAIYPMMTVRQNIEFGLKNNRVPKAERERRISEVAKVVGLEPYLERKPSQLSGGQRQRVALARAMVKEPKVFLMDEPLSNLDAKLRAAMRSELVQLHKQLQTTFVYVTHDQVEAMAMGDCIILMDQGKVMQQADPETIYGDPDNIFAAQFIGTPPTNILTMGSEGFKLGFRPEAVSLSGSPLPNKIFTRRAVITTREMLGAETLYKLHLEDGQEVMARLGDSSLAVGDVLQLQVEEESIYFFDAKGDRVRKDVAQDYLALLERVQRSNES
ncbi:MAG: ABC transporter ATP-binding protein [Firmicutes bacterium]|nr:ABC transporter ATP-binding protein [Bacillota bacterium]